MAINVYVANGGAYDFLGVSVNGFVKAGGQYHAWDAPNVVIKANGVYDFGAGVVPFNLTPPSIAGDPFFGETLTCTPGTWDGTPTPVVTHQWQHNGADILGATGLTYEVQYGDAATNITCLERGSSVAGSTSIASNALAVPPRSGFSRGFSATGFGV